MRALARASRTVDIELHMIGAGEMTKSWKNLAKVLKCESCIIWHGRVERGKANEIMANSDVLA